MMTGTSGRAVLAFGNSSRPLIPGMLISDKIRMGEMAFRVAYIAQRRRRGLAEFHGKAAGAKVAPELLAKQRLDVRLVVDHEDERGHARSPDLTGNAAARGSTMRNSVKLPGCESTSIDPACCLTMMS